MSRMTRREASCQVWKRTTEVDCGAPLRSRVGAALGTPVRSLGWFCFTGAVRDGRLFKGRPTGGLRISRGGRRLGGRIG